MKEGNILALKRIQNQIDNGSELEKIDSITQGDKYIHCSWGLCSCSEVQWPDNEDRFREDIKDFPLLIKDRTLDQYCPFDKGKNGEYGCFYRCRIFQDGLKDREEALKLYDITLKEHLNEATLDSNIL